MGQGGAEVVKVHLRQQHQGYLTCTLKTNLEEHHAGRKRVDPSNPNRSSVHGVVVVKLLGQGQGGGEGEVVGVALHGLLTLHNPDTVVPMVIHLQRGTGSY